MLYNTDKITFSNIFAEKVPRSFCRANIFSNTRVDQGNKAESVHYFDVVCDGMRR